MQKSNWKVTLIVAAGVIAVILMCVIGVYSSQNKAISMEEQVKTAQSDIKVQEKRRADLVYNLADCVKQYDSHEAETLKAVVDGRGQAGDIENVTTAITAVSEAYPELYSLSQYFKKFRNSSMISDGFVPFSIHNRLLSFSAPFRTGQYGVSYQSHIHNAKSTETIFQAFTIHLCTYSLFSH